LACFWGGLLALGALAPLVCLIWQWPGPDRDSIAFLPAALHCRQGDGLINPVWSGIEVTDPSGQDRFTLHGPLFPLWTAALMPSATIESLQVPLLVFRLVNVLILVSAVTALVSRQSGPGAARTWRSRFPLAMLVILADGAMRTGMYGRPEILAAPLLAAGFGLLMFRIGGSVCGFAAFGLLGVCAAVSPAVGFLAVLAGLTVLTSTKHFGEASTGRRLGLLVLMGVVAVAVFAICLSLTPHGLAESLSGIRRAGERDAGKGITGLGRLLRYGLVWWDRPFFGPPMLLAVGTAALALWKRAAPSSRWWLVAGQCACLAGIWFFGIRVANVNYNLAAFSTVGFAWLLAWAWEEPGTALPSVARARWRCGLVAALLLPCQLVHLKTGVEIAHMMRAGTGLGEARRAIRRVIRPGDCLLVKSGTWILLPEGSVMREWQEPLPFPELEGDRTLWVRQLVPSSNNERTRSEERKWKSVFQFGPAERPQVFGVPVTKFGPGYAFEVLQRVEGAHGGMNSD